jgi:protein-tyrosine-phosphatase
MKTILFVCTANICRSPMAAGIMRARIETLGLSDRVRVISAGVWAEPGQSASANAITTLDQRGIELGSHRSQPLTPELLREADVILVMEESHRRSIFYAAPQYLAKVFLLTEMAGRHDDVGDPYGGPLALYGRTADLLESLIDAGLPAVLKRLGVSL